MLSIRQSARQAGNRLLVRNFPTVAIEQRVTRGSHKSTVGSATEIAHPEASLLELNAIEYC